MNIHKYILLFTTLFITASCDLLQSDGMENPNVEEDAFLQTNDAMKAWTAGANKTLATVVDDFCELTELVSDNYYNNYTMNTQVFDNPRLDYNDENVDLLQRDVAKLRATALEGLNVVAKSDPATTDSMRYVMYKLNGYSYLLAGEYFVGLPISSGGEVMDSRINLRSAVAPLLSAYEVAPNNNDKATAALLLARAYRNLAMRDSATMWAQQSLELSPMLTDYVRFDGVNGMTNWTQFYLFESRYQPLPRLDFLDPKYFWTSSATDQHPICLAKAEEAYLIMAEAEIAARRLDAAREHLAALLALIANRPVQQGVNDQGETRGAGGHRQYPNTADYMVAASPDDEFRSGLIVDRRAPRLIAVPYVSGTSVTRQMIMGTSTSDALLQLLYLIRQEVFLAEGRRMADLGIKMPLSRVEAHHASNGADYTEALIPSFIPKDNGMDDFTVDENKKTVTIKYNMNRIIVENKRSPYVCPFETKN